MLKKSIHVLQDKLIAYQALIKAFIFTLLMLAVFQLGTHLTLPGLELKSSSSADSTSPMSLLSMFGGGGSKYFSIFLLGVSPYITASIIINVLCSGLIPSLSKKIKNSKNAKTIMEKMIYVLAIPLAILQGLLFIASSNNPNLIKLFTRNNPNLSHKYDFYLALLIIFLIFGTCFAVWLGNLITSYGICNGVSLLIFTSITVGIVDNFLQMFTTSITSNWSANTAILNKNVVSFMTYVLALIFIMLFVIFVANSERRVPLQQTGKALSSDKTTISSFLPFKINIAGILPVIFASTIMSGMQMIVNYLQMTDANKWLNMQVWQGMLVYSAFIVFFIFVYAGIQVNSDEISKSFQKAGTYIPGLKPGKQTYIYLKKIIHRLNFMSSFVLLTVSWVPFLMVQLVQLPAHLMFSGTSFIVMVSVALEIKDNLKALVAKAKMNLQRNLTDDQGGLW